MLRGVGVARLLVAEKDARFLGEAEHVRGGLHCVAEERQQGDLVRPSVEEDLDGQRRPVRREREHP